MTETEPTPREVRPLRAPAATSDTLVLVGSTRLYLRPIDTHDRDGLAALFGRLSPESRRLRYLLPKRALTSRELAGAIDVDHVRDEAIVAIDVSNGSIVGVARYAHDADRAGVADMAVEVADDLQGLGHRHAAREARCGSGPSERLLRAHGHDAVGEPRCSRPFAAPRVSGLLDSQRVDRPAVATSRRRARGHRRPRPCLTRPSATARLPGAVPGGAGWRWPRCSWEQAGDPTSSRRCCSSIATRSVSVRGRSRRCSACTPSA